MDAIITERKLCIMPECNNLATLNYYVKGRAYYRKLCDKHHKKKYGMTEGRKLKIYGITPEDWKKMFEEQHGCCAICGTHQSMFVKPLSVDHNHDTGNVRGLLCQMCNIALGYFRDDPKLMKKGIEYVQKYK